MSPRKWDALFEDGGEAQRSRLEPTTRKAVADTARLLCWVEEKFRGQPPRPPGVPWWILRYEGQPSR